MTEVKETIQAVENILIESLKTGPKSPTKLREIRKAISDLLDASIPTAEIATASYKLGILEFIDNMRQVRGMPTAQIFPIEKNKTKETRIVSSSGPDISKKFDVLLPKVLEISESCISRYGEQSKTYLADQRRDFQALIRDFLTEAPVDGVKDKSLRKKVAAIKKETKYLIEWVDMFDVYKAGSFAAEVEFFFALQNDPVAAIWNYNPLEEQGEYRKTYNHKKRNGRVYAVRDNWALHKGLMKPGSVGYIDDIIRPGQEVGCACYLHWIYSVDDLPPQMIMKGRPLSAHNQANQREVLQSQEVNVRATTESQSGLIDRLMALFGRR